MNLTVSTYNYIKEQWQHPHSSVPHKALIAVAALVALVATPILFLIDLCRLPCTQERAMNAMSILDFYQGGRNDRGVTLEEIWSWDDGLLESRHDFIQWLFPLLKGSAFNPTAAVTTQAVIEAFNADKTLQDKMVHSFDVMLQFYGLQRNANDEVELAPQFAAKAQNWLTRGNHNYLRITRILTSLRLHGLEEHSQAFFEGLKKVYLSHADRIGAQTFSFWKSAVAS